MSPRKNPLLRGKARSELSKRIWRKRKREGGKATCFYCFKPIYARGVMMEGRPYHKVCAELYGAGLKRAELVRNSRLDDRRRRIPRDAFRYFGARELNPGAHWHDEQAKKALEYLEQKGRSEYVEGVLDAHLQSMTASRAQGILNPRYVFGPTGFRPPAKWFAKMAQGVSASYFGKKLRDLTKSQSARVGQIVGGIWARFSDKTRLEILKKYEPAAARANPIRKKDIICYDCALKMSGENKMKALEISSYQRALVLEGRTIKCSACGKFESIWKDRTWKKYDDLPKVGTT